MTVGNYFDLSRFWLLLTLELFRNRKGILMLFVILFEVLFFIGMLLAMVVENKAVYDSHASNYAYTLMIGGIIVSSFAFNDLGNNLRTLHYLTLPISTLERFLSMWLLTSVGWIVLYTLAYSLYVWLANQIGPLIFSGATFENFEPLGEFSITIMKYYLVVQGIFLVGAAHFKGNVLLKTLFTLAIVAFISGLLIYLFWQDVFLAEHECGPEGCEHIHYIGEHPIWKGMKAFFWWVLAPLCWVLTYLGLKEKEV